MKKNKSNKTLEHVGYFLFPLDPVGSVLKFSNSLLDAADSDPSVAKSVQYAIDWVNHQRVLLQDLSLKAGCLRRMDDSIEVTLLAVSCFRLEEILRRVNINSRNNLKKGLNLSESMIKGFESDIEDNFFYELLASTERLAKNNRSFEVHLEQWKNDISSMLIYITNTHTDKILRLFLHLQTPSEEKEVPGIVFARNQDDIDVLITAFLIVVVVTITINYFSKDDD